DRPAVQRADPVGIRLRYRHDAAAVRVQYPDHRVDEAVPAGQVAHRRGHHPHAGRTRLPLPEPRLQVLVELVHDAPHDRTRRVTAAIASLTLSSDSVPPCRAAVTTQVDMCSP